jgi:hypothetical protein
MSGKVGDNPYRASGVIAAAGGAAITWCTTAKTGNFCAEAGSGYLVNTCSTAFTATLPCSPTVGDQVAFVDFAGTFDSNPLTLGRNTKKIKSQCKCGNLGTERGAVTVIYTGTAQGWITTSQANAETVGFAEYITASGGNQPTATGCIVCTDYKVHTFTGTGPFNVTAVGNPAGSSIVDYLVVAGGGGGGGSEGGGGGGAGGYRESVPSPAAWTGSPIANPGGGLTATVQNYTLTVGGAGTAGSPSGNGGSGTTSVFSTITSAGGGGGGQFDVAGIAGGSGGGGGGRSNTAGGAGNTPPTSPLPAQGFAGGNAKSPGTNPDLGGGGGGATVVGTQGGASPNPTGSGPGGAGGGTALNPSPSYGTPGPSPSLRYFSGGGGAGKDGDSPNSAPAGAGGTGGGGQGASNDPGSLQSAVAGGENKGGGGGGSGGTPACRVSKAGGKGVVIVRYKFQ